MSYKEKIKRIVATSFVIFLINAVMFSDTVYNWIENFFDPERIFLAFFFFPIVLIILSVVLFRLRDQIFHSWWRFARVYLLVAAAIILITPASSTGNYIMSIDAELVTWWLAGLFLTISLLLIAIKSWKLRKQQPQI